MNDKEHSKEFLDGAYAGMLHMFAWMFRDPNQMWFNDLKAVGDYICDFCHRRIGQGQKYMGTGGGGRQFKICCLVFKQGDLLAFKSDQDILKLIIRDSNYD